MREPYVPLFCSITKSTLWNCENSDTRVVFITLLAMADPEGYVASSLPGIAKEACLPVEVTRAAMERLQQPDPDSRSREEEGRRVLVVDRGWRVVNIKAFRDLARREAELARKRKWWRENRGKSRRSLDQLDAPAVAEAKLDASLDAPKAKAKAKGKQRERTPSLSPSESSQQREPAAPPPQDPFRDSLVGKLPHQREDVQSIVRRFGQLAQMPAVALRAGDYRGDIVAAAIEAYGLDGASMALEQAAFDDTVNGRGTNAQGTDHWDLRYIFKPAVCERLIKDSRQRQRAKARPATPAPEEVPREERLTEDEIRNLVSSRVG